MILISNDFCHKIKMYNFEPYNVLLAIATDIVIYFFVFRSPGEDISNSECFIY